MARTSKPIWALPPIHQKKRSEAVGVMLDPMSSASFDRAIAETDVYLAVAQKEEMERCRWIILQ